jgi:PII-like signaling protein
MYSQEADLLLRIFIGENDHFDGRPLYESIVLKAREQGLAGATVLRGPMGFGHSSRLHTAKILRLSQDLPVVVEIVDTKEKITAFLSLLDGMVKGGLVTLEEIQVVRYGPGQNKLS